MIVIYNQNGICKIDPRKMDLESALSITNSMFKFAKLYFHLNKLLLKSADEKITRTAYAMS